MTVIIPMPMFLSQEESKLSFVGCVVTVLLGLVMGGIMLGAAYLALDVFS